jgi:beta-glucosidase
MTSPLAFPPGFLWGTATSAHQVEGGNEGNDWADWEREPGRIRGGARAGPACDFWNRAEEDLALAASLGTNAFRFSVEWSRIEPEPGRFDEAALARYAGWAVRCRALGLEPMVCLHHFTLPRWLARRGGFAWSGAVERFARLAEVVADAMAGAVRWWLTVNEPMVLAALGHVQGVWPPGRRSVPEALRVARHLVRAHAAAYHVLHARVPGALVSAAHHLAVYVPHDPRSRLDRAATWLRDRIMNRLFLEATLEGRLAPPLGAGERVPEAAGSHDYLAFQPYFTYPLAFSATRAGGLFAVERHTPRPGAPPFMGEFRPEAPGIWAERLAAHGLPLVVTEHGLLEAQERDRPGFIVAALTGLHRALRRGADLRGYFHWSLLDNFEWAEGFEARFGLVGVDLATQARTPRPSARIYGSIARQNAIPTELLVRPAA